MPITFGPALPPHIHAERIQQVSEECNTEKNNLHNKWQECKDGRYFQSTNGDMIRVQSAWRQAEENGNLLQMGQNAIRLGEEKGPAILQEATLRARHQEALKCGNVLDRVPVDTPEFEKALARFIALTSIPAQRIMHIELHAPAVIQFAIANDKYTDKVLEYSSLRCEA